MHRSPRPPASTRAWISATGPEGTDVAVHGAPGAQLHLSAVPDAERAAAVRRGVDRVLWQALGTAGAEVYAVAHRRPRRLRVAPATALGLLEAGVPTVVRSGAPA